MQADKEDLTRGAMSDHFRNLAIPAAFGMLFSTLYNVVDVYWAGRISTEAQAGLAIGYQAFFILMSVGIGLSSGLSALVSNAKGEKNDTLTRRFIAQGISFGVIAAALLMVLGSFLGPFLIVLVSEPGGYREAATGYFRWLIFALPGFLIAFGGNGILQAHGDSRSMQRAMMVAFLANIALNPLFIFGIPGLWSGMGFNGIALSTIVSQTGVMCWIHVQGLAPENQRQPGTRRVRPQPCLLQGHHRPDGPGHHGVSCHVRFGIRGAVLPERLWRRGAGSLWRGPSDRTDPASARPWHDGRALAHRGPELWRQMPRPGARGALVLLENRFRHDSHRGPHPLVRRQQLSWLLHRRSGRGQDRHQLPARRCGAVSALHDALCHQLAVAGPETPDLDALDQHLPPGVRRRLLCLAIRRGLSVQPLGRLAGHRLRRRLGLGSGVDHRQPDRSGIDRRP